MLEIHRRRIRVRKQRNTDDLYSLRIRRSRKADASIQSFDELLDMDFDRL